MTLSYIESEHQPAFEHAQRPFSEKKSEPSDLLKLAQKYNSFRAPPNNNDTTKYLEHGNYKLFGLSRN